MTVHLLPSTPRTVRWGDLPCAGDPSVLTVDPGDVVVVDTVSHEGILEDQGRDPLAFFTARGVPADAVLADAVEIARTVAHDPLRQGPHVVTGPVHVRGARPGDVLSVTVEELVLRADHGVVSNRHGRGALPGEFPRDGQDVVSVLARVETDPRTGTRCGAMPVAEGSAARVRFPLRPFLGLVGVGTPGPEHLHSVPRGCTAGTSTSPSSARVDAAPAGPGGGRPVPHRRPALRPGRRRGRAHGVRGPAARAAAARPRPEAAVRVRDVLWGETPEFLVPIGLDVDLDEAARRAVRTAVALLVDLGMDPAHALAYLSAAGDFAVSQVVDRVSGVHGLIRKADLADLTERPPRPRPRDR